MKSLRKLVPFARPLHHFIPEYLIYTFLGIVFGLLNFALLVPVLGLLFGKEAKPLSLSPKPEFSFSIKYFEELFHHYFSKMATLYGSFGALVFVCAIIGFSILLSNIFRYLAVKVLMRLRLKVMERIRNTLYEKYISQSLSYHHNQRKGDLLVTMTNEVQEIESSIINSLQVLFRDPFVVIVYFFMLFYWSYQLTLFTLFFLPLTGIAISSITKKLKKLGYFSQEMMSEVVSLTDESISGIRQVQSFTAGKFMLAKFQSINRAFSNHSKLMFGKKEMASPISEVLGVIAALTLVIFGGYLIFNHKTALSGEGFIAYILLYTQIIPPLKNLTQTSTNLQRGYVAVEKIFKTIEAPVSITNPANPEKLSGFSQAININNISFSYGQADVIKQLSLTVPKGKVVALVGQSGSGKSTLVDLICRFYDVQSGSISLDGIDVRNCMLDDLRGMISVVSQDTFLFNDSIANNISFGNTQVSIAEVEAAAKAANAHEFISKAENGYQTVIGERGVKLSGGQRQRITIARAILKNAPILILDEATSALDTESERLVQDAINNVMKDRTTIVIAHRLSTVKHADEIIVLNQGQIAERGTHESLLAQDGIYRRLVEMQEIG